MLSPSGVEKVYDYDAYGNQLSIETGDENPYRYCGEYYDEETGFIYLRARYYSPETGRFISQDPAKDGINWYAYCNNNPLAFVDRNGLWPTWDQLLTAAAIVVTAAVVVAATVATAGAAGAAIGIAAGMAVGNTAVIGTVATVATGFIYGVAGYVGATAVSDTIEIFSGYNPIRDFVFKGNTELYETTKILAYGAAAGFTEIGSQYQNYAPTSSHYKRNGKSPDLRISDSQLGIKWGKHRSDYKGILNNHNDYLEYADYIFYNPDKIVYDYRNHEYYYISGNDLLRVNENYEFISLYPGANTKRVLNAINDGGVLR